MHHSSYSVSRIISMRINPCQKPNSFQQMHTFGIWSRILDSTEKNDSSEWHHWIKHRSNANSHISQRRTWELRRALKVMLSRNQKVYNSNEVRGLRAFGKKLNKFRAKWGCLCPKISAVYGAVNRDPTTALIGHASITFLPLLLLEINNEFADMIWRSASGVSLLSPRRRLMKPGIRLTYRLNNGFASAVSGKSRRGHAKHPATPQRRVTLRRFSFATDEWPMAARRAANLSALAHWWTMTGCRPIRPSSVSHFRP